ncbi:MAG TPA: FmdB family zinc ribbon protein [Terriglobales bacterium]|nr:FmdB family zinc ribbon protein [Terriglobales bacterium]
MPIYEYQCKKCGHRFEKIQKFSDPAIKKCPECGGAVEKLLTAPAAHFKGEGWYVTDYARKGAKGGESSAESSKETKGEAKLDSKPDAKPDHKPEKKHKK